MVDCALEDVFVVVDEVLKVVHSRFGEDGTKEVDKNSLFAEAEEKLYGGHNRKEVINIPAGSFINKLKKKSNCVSSKYNSNSNPSHLTATISLSDSSKSIANAQNKKKHIQHVSGTTISKHIQNMVSKKLDQSVITKNVHKKSNERPVNFSKSPHIHEVAQQKVRHQDPSDVVLNYSDESLSNRNNNKIINENSNKSFISSHIQKVVQGKIRNLYQIMYA